MKTQTIEAQPKNNTVAISTPSELNFYDTVLRNAHRKAQNGSQFSSTKGKTSLLLCVIDDVRSQLGIAKFDEDNHRTNLPDDIFAQCKKAVESFWHTEATSLVERAIANDAKITVRSGVLMSRKGKADKIVRSKTDRFTSVYAPKASEHKFCDMVGLTAAKSRLDAMLDNVGKWSREELDSQRKWIETLEIAISQAK
jgi:hypothetical protein